MVESSQSGYLILFYDNLIFLIGFIQRKNLSNRYQHTNFSINKCWSSWLWPFSQQVTYNYNYMQSFILVIRFFLCFRLFFGLFFIRFRARTKNEKQKNWSRIKCMMRNVHSYKWNLKKKILFCGFDLIFRSSND